MGNESLPLQIDGKSKKFSRSRITTRIALLSLYHEILVCRQISLNSKIVEISCISRRMDESHSDFWHDGLVPCGTREEETWHMNRPSVMPSNHARR